MNKREKLARILARARYLSIGDNPLVNGAVDNEWEDFLEDVDAILDELMEPSERAITGVLIKRNALGVVCEDDERRKYTGIWQAILTHIKEDRA